MKIKYNITIPKKIRDKEFMNPNKKLIILDLL